MTTLETMRRIEELCSQFEADGKLGGDTVDSLLDRLVPSERTLLALELIALDAELRWRLGGSPLVADYAKTAKREDVDLDDLQIQQLIDEAQQTLSGRSSKPPEETDRYRFIEPIDRGAYGDIWSVEDKLGGRILAIKILRQTLLDDPNANARLLREALLTGRLQHPGIPPVYDHGTFADGTAYYTMKLVGGETLESILNDCEEEGIRLQTCLTVFHSVVQTVAYAHSQDIIHRDLKPHNVMVGNFGEVQVMDWGMAKWLANPNEEPWEDWSQSNVKHRSAADETQLKRIDTSQSLTTDGDVLGTPAYMSPEQARGEKQALNPRSDVFSLGAILYRILTGERLHHGRAPHDTIQRMAEGEFVDEYSKLAEVEVHPDLIQLCYRCLSASAEARPDAREVGRRLAEYFASVQQRAQRAEIERREAVVRQFEVTRRRRVQLLGACAVAIASALGMSVAFWQRGEALAAQQQAVDAQAQESRAKATAIREAETAEEVNEFLLELLASARPEENGVDVTVREMLDSMLPHVGDSFQDKPKVEGLIRRALGTTYRSLGLKDVALEQHRLAVEAFERVDPLDEEELLNAQDRLAGVLRSRGTPAELKEALRLRQHVLTRVSELFGEQDARTVLAMNNLAIVHANLNNYSQAQELMERAIELEEASGQADPMSLDFSRYNLASFAFDSGDYATAERVFLQLLNRYRSDPEAIRLYLELPNVIALLYQEQGRDQEALQFFDEAYQSRKQHLGVLHDKTLSSMRKLGRHLIAMRKYQDALTLLEESLDHHNEFFGIATSLTFSVRENMAQALIGLDRREEAEQCLRETVAILTKERGDDYQNTQEARKQLEQFLAK